MENNKENAMRDLTEQELEKTAGGDVLDDALCLIRGHVWKEVKTVGFSGGPYYHEYLCTCCGKHRYTVVDENRNTRTISETEFHNGINNW